MRVALSPTRMYQVSPNQTCLPYVYATGKIQSRSTNPIFPTFNLKLGYDSWIWNYWWNVGPFFALHPTSLLYYNLLHSQHVQSSHSFSNHRLSFQLKPSINSLFTCVALPTNTFFLPILRSNRQLEPPPPLNFSYRIFCHSALAPNFSNDPILAGEIWAPWCTPESVAKRQQFPWPPSIQTSSPNFENVVPGAWILRFLVL